ncbi:sodium:solute symporter family protein [Synechococcus elongatus]|uniref:Sodium:solute symporter family protein n=1 Tax=Synechococcus elongatus PCC 11801 TaxID=2219813 RepID=A0AAN1QPP2_SYNEL|nr:sodium:solute symporter family protein [Synechococcus elongatus]AZB73188.1 sodium:proline symporter [Synechococcus elongatus PCC 11801]
MQLLDWVVIGLYLVISLGIGLYFARRASRGIEDFFLSGRSLPWWLSGASMAATTFSVDTPLYVAGLVGTRGIAGNWEWWCFGLAHVSLIYIFARLWRRSEIITDAELTELRYGGQTAAWLRGIKAFLFAVPINCIGIGYAILAMTKTIEALGVWNSLGFDVGENSRLWSVIAICLIVLVYSGVSGLWGVVVTDFFQLVLALVGALIVAASAVSSIGGMGNLVDQLQAMGLGRSLDFLPFRWSGGSFDWTETAGLTTTTFLAYLGLQWWTFRRSDGGGEFIQRLAASRTEGDAAKAAWLFNIINYVVRTWPWVIVGLAALVLYPNLSDRELGYPKLMLDFLPPGLLGLVAASLLAAFMSTVSTSINWGASYLTNDLYRRFWRSQASAAELVTVGRLASVFVTVLGAVTAFFSDDVGTVFRLVIAIGTGPGVVLILRWYWWRINAAAELAAMLAGFVVGLSTSVLPWLKIPDFGLRLLVTTLISAAIWITVMLLTPPEPESVLQSFYARIRPGGPGWRRQQQQSGLAPIQDLRIDGLRIVAASLLLFGSMFSVGGFLLLQPLTGWLALLTAVLGGFWLRKLSHHRLPTLPTPTLLP